MCQVTAITHTHPLGLLGALLQAHAIRRVIGIAGSGNGDSLASVDAMRLVDDLRGDLESADLSAFAFGRPSNFHESALQAYVGKLETVKRFSTQHSIPTLNDIVKNLGVLPASRDITNHSFVNHSVISTR